MTENEDALTESTTAESTTAESTTLSRLTPTQTTPTQTTPTQTTDTPYHLLAEPMVVEADPENSQEDAAYQPRPGTRVVGVGPLPQPWPDDPRLDPVLLSEGDHRNVIDKYRYWSVEAIKADLTATQSLLHLAIENLEHDLNIGSIVRSGNAFNVGGVHIVGRRRWNKRGALVTDRYIEIYYHSTAQELAEWAREHSYRLVAIDNPPHSTRLEETQLPERCLLVFGQESTGISQELQDVCQDAVRIEQYGSTRSMNVAAAAAIAMHWWVSQHRRPQHVK